MYLCRNARHNEFFQMYFSFFKLFLEKYIFFFALALEIKETQSFLNLNCEIPYYMNICKTFETCSV